MDENRVTGSRTDTGTTTTVTTDGDKDKDRGRGCGCWIALLLVLLLGGGAGATIGGMQILRQETPLPLEPEITDLGLRWLAIPAEYADMRIPRRNPDVTTAKGRELYTVQCALCHGNNGNGDGPFGITQYPKASNLHEQRVRSKSEGQLFWIIAHGINLTGMPAWGTKYGGGNSDNEIWSLVKFIREEYHGEKIP
ncbi:MAG: cytochrome c [Chloroflexota bacterium]|nr:cytochrome c [Chloroflexota bacterium]